VTSDQLSVERLTSLVEVYVIPFAIDLLIALAVFFVGRWIARMLTRMVGRLMRRAHTDESLVKFISDVVHALLLTLVVIAALERLGIKTTAAVAVIGAAGLAIGLALQGSLGNFASGVLIMVFKPYAIGDTVQIAGKVGTVATVHIFTTVLHTSDMRKVIIPNGAITSGSVENYTALGSRRIELVVVIAEAGEVDQTKADLRRVLEEEERVAREPAPDVAMLELAEKKVSYSVHATVKTDDFGAVKAELIERVRQRFEDRLVSAKAV